ncbi:MAG: ribonuclease R family protein, partial [Desulfopila sp.]
MSKKRTISKGKNKNRQDSNVKKPPEQKSLDTLPGAIVAFLFRQKAPLPLNDIHQGLGDAEHSKKATRDALEYLIRKGDIVVTGKKHYAMNDNGTIFSGTVEKNPRGFGFVTDLQPRQAANFKKDPFLTVKRIGTANQGDTVLIRIKRVRSDGRPEAELIAILKRFCERLTGFFQSGKPPRVHPEDPRYPASIHIVEAVDHDIANGHVVIVEVLPDPSKQGYVRGKIVEVLGSAENIDVQMRMVIEKHNLPHAFPDSVTQEAADLSFDEHDYSNREDLRHIPHITIDGATAKDFDDAIAVEKRSSGFRLYVSIADVSHFVKPGTALDKEAYLRGTSIYFPDRVIPMLPEKLSNHLCSLVPDEDRLTFSAILDFSATGKLKKKNFCKSVIRSRQRFTYTTVKEIIVDQSDEQRAAHKKLVQLLDEAKELAVQLHARRMQRGSIGFNIPEPEITLGEEGKIQSIARKKRNFAHQMIEEFMLAANEAVARSLNHRNIPCIHRVHDDPDPDKLDEFSDY